MKPLVINLRHLVKRELQLQGELPSAELDLNQLDPLIQVTAPVQYDLSVEKMEKTVLVTGRVGVNLECQCVRCLSKFIYQIDLQNFALALSLEGEEKVALDGDFVDLTPYVREDILLAFPQHPLCKAECGGLQTQPSPGKEAQPGQESQMTSSAWAVLNDLKLK